MRKLTCRLESVIEFQVFIGVQLQDPDNSVTNLHIQMPYKGKKKDTAVVMLSKVVNEEKKEKALIQHQKDHH